MALRASHLAESEPSRECADLLDEASTGLQNETAQQITQLPGARWPNAMDNLAPDGAKDI